MCICRFLSFTFGLHCVKVSNPTAQRTNFFFFFCLWGHRHIKDLRTSFRWFHQRPDDPKVFLISRSSILKLSSLSDSLISSAEAGGVKVSLSVVAAPSRGAALIKALDWTWTWAAHLPEPLSLWHRYRTGWQTAPSLSLLQLFECPLWQEWKESEWSSPFSCFESDRSKTDSSQFALFTSLSPVGDFLQQDPRYFLSHFSVSCPSKS